jgi:RNA polymerase sigma-70 factor, ECF subfamily
MRNQSIQEAKRKQFLELYNRESDAIFRFCLLRTSDSEKAVDLTQDTFMRFWDVVNRDDEPITYERAFLFKIARNLIIDWYRKKKSLSLDSILESEDGINDSLLIDKDTTNLEMSGEARFVLEKISELEPMYQQVVYMRFVEDMKPKEISEILGESVNVVSVRITRGIEKLREITGYEK